MNDAANEPSLAVSPIDPDILVIGWRQFPTINSDRRFAGYAYSSDGGSSWTNGGTLAPPPNRPATSEQTDPVLAVDSDGIFYYWSEVFRPEPPTSHHVYRSNDDGATWSVPTQVQDPATPGDKEWMVIDRTNGLGNGLIHGGWSSFSEGHVYVRSTDGGQTFSEPLRIADVLGQQFMIHFAVGPDGELYAAWRHYSSNSIFVTKSTNANDPSVTPAFDAFGAGRVNGLDVRIDDGDDPGALSVNPAGFHQIWLGVDRSNSENRGDVYCMWAARRDDRSDIYFARSTDGGLTWQTNIRVNDDPLGSRALQWMVAMDVAPNGRIDAVWYDTRDDTSGRLLSALYYSFSTDGGSTWSLNKRLSDSFDTTVGYPQQPKIGDYTQIISSDSDVNVAYAGTFNGEQDIWFMRIPFLVPGDLNCDGRFDGADIDPFFLALGNPTVYQTAFPECNILNGDMNCDQALNGADIDRFFDCLAGNNCPDVVIHRQPQGQELCLGNTLALSVDATGLDLRYQWHKDGALIPGATQSTYRANAVTLDDAGVYEVEITNPCFRVRSDAATVTVTEIIFTHPVSQTVCENDPALFSVFAVGQSLTYQWRKDGVDIPGATSTLFLLPAAQLSDAGVYDVVVGSATCNQVSDPATLTVQRCP